MGDRQVGIHLLRDVMIEGRLEAFVRRAVGQKIVPSYM